MLTLAAQTMFADLLQRCLDAEFDDLYDERGSFKKRKSKGHFYWHYIRDVGGKKVETYVGPVTDKSITSRISRFAEIKSDFRQRQEMVRALIAAGLPRPDPTSGEVVEAMWKAGFFRLRGVLIGTMAYQCYGGLLGAKLGAASLRTEDADFAQFWGISENVGDAMSHPLTVLRMVDETFREVPDILDPFVTWRYTNKDRYKVEFLTPNRGSDEHQSRPAKMKALSDAGAQPLRHLDYLIYRPERSVFLFKGGIPVAVPRCERYAVHKLIVAVERQDQVKSRKDIVQAASLIEHLSTQRPFELADAWDVAWATGQRWREKLDAGHARLPDAAKDALQKARDSSASSSSRKRKAVK